LGWRISLLSLLGAELRESFELSMEQVSSSPKWRSRSSSQIVWAIFDQDYVAFHRPSGKTHFLNEASYLLISEILAEPQSLDTIIRELLSGEDEANPAAYAGQMRAMLDHLENFGLVDRL